ncbi:hypothetical protein QBC39DRAFT_437560 [Podospora conica]|nr:hypothetical protein QBC39DRAFT_437560 [Schizothecium conicum]
MKRPLHPFCFQFPVVIMVFSEFHFFFTTPSTYHHLDHPPSPPVHRIIVLTRWRSLFPLNHNHITSLPLRQTSTMNAILSDCVETRNNTVENTRSGGRNGSPGARKRVKGAPRPVVFWRVDGILHWGRFIRPSVPRNDEPEESSKSPSWLQPWVKLDPYLLDEGVQENQNPRLKKGVEKKTVGFSTEMEVCLFNETEKPKKVAKMLTFSVSLDARGLISPLAPTEEGQQPACDVRRGGFELVGYGSRD